MKFVKEEGFSLLEVSVAVGIMAILTAIAIPAFTGLIPSTQEKVASQEERNCNVEDKLNELVAESNDETYINVDCTPTTSATGTP